MQVSKFNFQIIQFNQSIDVELSIFKLDELTRYRAVICNRIIMLYRQNDGRFQIYDCGDWIENDLAKKIADWIIEKEKQVGGLIHNHLQIGNVA